MASNSFDTTLLKGSIQETGFTEDIVTECLTARCSECKGEYVNLVLRHKFVCRCACHKTITAHHKREDLNIL
jgi:hypothetical protein